ncbi:MAG TPA: hypothetical protein VJA21_17915 [Verrucomicrobiae bacterium]
MNASFEVKNGYLYVKATGEYEPAEARRIFFELVARARREGLTRILCDDTLLSGLDDQIELTMTQYSLASFVAESLPKDIKLAILASPEQLAKDRFAENVMRNKGAAVKMTLSLNEALEWLDLPQPCPMPAPASCCA